MYMHVITQTVVSSSSITVAAALVLMLREMQQIRLQLKSQRLRQLQPGEYRTSLPVSSKLHAAASSGFAIYVYRNGVWHLEADLSAPGCEAVQPTLKGSFEGHVIKKESSGRK